MSLGPRLAFNPAGFSRSALVILGDAIPAPTESSRIESSPLAYALPGPSPETPQAKNTRTPARTDRALMTTIVRILRTQVKGCSSARQGSDGLRSFYVDPVEPELASPIPPHKQSRLVPRLSR